MRLNLVLIGQNTFHNFFKHKKLTLTSEETFNPSVFLCPILTYAQIEERYGLIQYKEVFVDTDDFGLEYLEDLEKLFPFIQKDSLLRLKILNDQGYYYHIRNLNKAVEVTNQGIDEAIKLKNSYCWKGKLEISQVVILLRMEELDLAELLLTNALVKIPEPESWLLYINLGYVHERRGDLDKAFDFVAKTLKICETHGD